MPAKHTRGRSLQQRSRPSLGELFGTHRVSQRDLQRLHESLDRAWVERFTADRRRWGAHAARAGALYEPIRDLMMSEPQSAAIIRRELGVIERRRHRVLTPPKVEPRREGVSLGSLVVSFTPPYDFWWSIVTFSDSANGEETADRDAGTLNSALDAFMNHLRGGSSAGGFAGVGVYYAPMGDCPAQLTVDASLAFDARWLSDNSGVSTHNDGWIELEIRRFNLDATDETVVANRHDVIWNEDAFWWGYDRSRTEVAYRMSVSTTADNLHFYNIWVKCGGGLSAATTPPLAVSGAESQLAVSVPEIRCTLG